ncbi:MAG TPA: lipopolysaccharide kinase InaA family protein [Gemmatimonadaceae bacterium]|nr:lipopolysaccharide kinase InaA family protein [Gemmatimonadaceae bacterium]
MIGVSVETPPGYERVASGGALAVVRQAEADDVRQMLGAGTLHALAARDARRREYSGRRPVYGIDLPRSGTSVVVRHATHGGMLAPITRDLFVAPGRAPEELRTAATLRDAGVPTPAVVGFALYPARGPLVTIDVMVEEIAPAQDLADAFGGEGSDRGALIELSAQLIAALARAGARHEDLNLKNILIAFDGATARPAVVDVDRVVLGVPRLVALDANLARFSRSARKLRARRGLPVSEAELETLARRARELVA